MEGIRIIGFGPAHAAAVAGLCDREGWDGWGSAAVVGRALAAPGATTLVAVDGTQVVGAIQIIGDGAITWTVGMLIVASAERGRGIGRALLARAFAETGASRLDVLTEDGGPRFYRGLPGREMAGFRLYGPDCPGTAPVETRGPGVSEENGDFEVIGTVGQDRVPDILGLFASAWWAAGRSEEAVSRMLRGSSAAVGVTDASSGRLVAFARAVTDGVFVALVLDVVVDPAFRGRKLGRRVLGELLARPELERVDSIELVCQPELVGFYELAGFTDRVGRSLLMRRTANPRLRSTE